MHASSIKGIDCLPSAGLLATHPHRSFYMQIHSSLIKVSLKATGLLVQLIYKADARGVGLYLLQKGLLLGMRKSWLKGSSARSPAMPGQSQMTTVKQSARGELN